jgi:hypothetical protein
VFGILAYRFEKEAAGFNSSSHYVKLPSGEDLIVRSRYNFEKHRYEFIQNDIEQELKRPNSRLAFSTKTREYLRQRIWRTLKQLGEEGDRNYINMAVGVLLQYSHRDAEPVREAIFYQWNRSNWTSIKSKRVWDAYAGYLTFNHILYANSPRYELKLNSKAWRCREGYHPGDPEPQTREEAFPQLWEQNPQALLPLLQESECLPVHHFAVKVLKACPDFCSSLDINTIIQLVNIPYEVTAQFGFELALLNYNPSQANKELILALANCLSQSARNQAYHWIEEKREFFVEDSNFITALVISQQSDTRAFVRRLLSSFIIGDRTARV